MGREGREVERNVLNVCGKIRGSRVTGLSALRSDSLSESDRFEFAGTDQ